MTPDDPAADPPDDPLANPAPDDSTAADLAINEPDDAEARRALWRDIVLRALI